MKSSLTLLSTLLAISSGQAAPDTMLHTAFQRSASTSRRAATLTGFISHHTRPHSLSTTSSSPSSSLHAATSKNNPSKVSVNPREPTIPILESMPEPLPKLNNYYYLLRHGQSTANVEGIISSDRSLAGSTKHGLTPLGREQGRSSAGSLIDFIAEDVSGSGVGENNNLGIPSTKKVYFYSSPFARAKETAVECLNGIRETEEVAKKVEELGLDIKEDILLDDGLMERYFGRLDGKELATYAYVWPVDMFMPTHTAFDVESVAAVSSRIRSTLLGIDSQYPDGGNHIVLTSHADVLQITQCYAAGLENVGMFSQYRFGNGEVRKMGRDVESLPEAVPLQPPKRGEFAA